MKDKLQLISQKYKQLYTNKQDKVKKMDKFLLTYSFLRLNHEEIENLNRPIT